jgi:hypothetical protein
MKNAGKILSGLLLLMIIGIAGCKKPCYSCYDFSGWFIASKNGDTIVVGRNIYSRAILQDTINYYVRLGFTIDSVQQGWAPDAIADSECDYFKYNSPGLPAPDSCVEVM